MIIDDFIPRPEGNEVTLHTRLPGELTIAAEIILAVGQHAELYVFPQLNRQRNTIEQHLPDPTCVFAGDIVEGDKTVVWRKLAKPGRFII